MVRRQAVAELLRVLGITLALSLLMGLFLVWMNKPTIPFGVALAGYTTAFGGPIFGIGVGEKLGLELRRDIKRWRLVLGLVAAAIALLTVCYAIGANTPPIVGASESRWLFPGWCLVGLVAGGFSHSLRFRPDKKARDRRAYVIEIKFSEATDSKALLSFRSWLDRRFGKAADGDFCVRFHGARLLRAGIAEIREALRHHGLAQFANVTRKEASGENGN